MAYISGEFSARCVDIFQNRSVPPMNLSKLFGSKSRTKILEKFVIENVSGNSKAGFFIRELCRDLDEQINSVRRELMNLEEL